MNSATIIVFTFLHLHIVVKIRELNIIETQYGLPKIQFLIMNISNQYRRKL